MADDQGAGPSRRWFLGGIAAAAATTGVVATTGSQSEAAATQGEATVAEGRIGLSRQVRDRAADLAGQIGLPTQVANGDERADLAYALSFTKGLPHNYETGVVDSPADFERFVAAIDSGADASFRDVPLGPDPDGPRAATDETRLRGWETPGAGLCFNLVGADPQALAMPPAPRVGSAELTGEIAEIYAQAALRDEPLTTLRYDAADNTRRDTLIAGLNELSWYQPAIERSRVSQEAKIRQRPNLTPQTAFRGISPGETVGPYLSQLLLVGSSSGNQNPYDGIIEYGAQTIDQRVRRVSQTDFMASWDAWFDVANAIAPQTGELATGGRRFITTGRDLATYVHTDALYQAYFNACLVLLTNGVPLDPSLPYQRDDAVDHQQGFALYAMQHILALLGEVCDRALKTVLFQKFNVHRRLRPEELAARIEKADLLDVPELSQMAAHLNNSVIGDEIKRITQGASGAESMLLPLAYSEGSPMHPSYGAGHATVAGACVTILKVFFDHTRPFTIAGDASTAYVPITDGSRLATVNVLDEAGQPAELTVEGELNKLAANVSIGRNWAGVHYFSDYWESLLLGEQVAMQLLREHLLTVPQMPGLRVPRFDGSRTWL